MAKTLAEGRKPGSGRPRIFPKKQPVTRESESSGSDFFIPNYSGDHSEGTATKTPVNDYDIANKKYVDDNDHVKYTDAEAVAAVAADDAYLKNDDSDTTSGTITAAGFTTSGNISVGGHITDPNSDVTFNKDTFVDGVVSAYDFVTLSSIFEGDAVTELKTISSDSKGKLDHSTLPPFAKTKVNKPIFEDNKIISHEETDGVSMDKMISICVRALQQLSERIEVLEK